MKNGDVAFRGYAIIAPDGQVVLKQVNDYWGQELDKTVEDIKDSIRYIITRDVRRFLYKIQEMSFTCSQHTKTRVGFPFWFFKLLFFLQAMKQQLLLLLL